MRKLSAKNSKRLLIFTEITFMMLWIATGMIHYRMLQYFGIFNRAEDILVAVFYVGLIGSPLSILVAFCFGAYSRKVRILLAVMFIPSVLLLAVVSWVWYCVWNW